MNVNRALGMLAFFVLTATSTAANATSLIVAEGQTIYLSGEHIFDEIIIDGTVATIPFDDERASETGYLHLRANRIEVGATGLIEATGVGPPGTLSVASGANGVVMNEQPAPGGGGGHLGSKGGDGVQLLGSCNVLAEGGRDDRFGSTDPLILFSNEQHRGRGSAGGDGTYFVSGVAQTLPGGFGGGGILLVAARIGIQGELRADGAPGAKTPSTYHGVSGSGSGGTIAIVCTDCEFGPDATLSAKGGDAEYTTGIAAGSGAGGLVHLQTDTSVSVKTLTSSGQGEQVNCAEPTSGQDGSTTSAASSCVDADRDGAKSAQCGGDDCNDGRASVKPSATEACNGLDDNCDGQIDEPPQSGSLCPIGSEQCEAGSCQARPAGQLNQIELYGGLCALRTESTASTKNGSTNRFSSSFEPILMLLGAFLVVARRRRPN